jgi:hypothetical protein
MRSKIKKVELLPGRPGEELSLSPITDADFRIESEKIKLKHQSNFISLQKKFEQKALINESKVLGDLVNLQGMADKSSIILERNDIVFFDI